MEQMSTSFGTASQDCYVEVINQGIFNAYFAVSYSYNNSTFAFTSQILSDNDLEKIIVSKNATNINISVFLVTKTGQTNTLYTKTFTSPAILKLLLTGTESAPMYTDITNNPSPSKPAHYNYYVSVTNTAAFVGKLTIQYTLNNKNFNVPSDPILNNHTKLLKIPSVATNIQVTVQVRDKTSPWSIVYTKTLATATILKLSLSGTISTPLCTDITSQLDLGTLPPLTDGAISVMNNGAFTAQFIVNYDLADYSVADVSDVIVNGDTVAISIPATAQNIQLEIDLLNTDNSWLNIYQDTFSTATTVILQLTGTLSAPIVTDVTTNPPSVGDPVPPIIIATKTSNQTSYSLGNTVTLISTVSNTAGDDASNVLLKDTIPPEATFVANSLTLDGNTVSGTSFPSAGVQLGDMSSGDSHQVVYKIIFNTIPNPNPVENDPVINYNYLDANSISQVGTLTGTATPFTIVQSYPCGCCCCCPCMCNCPSTSSTNYSGY